MLSLTDVANERREEDVLAEAQRNHGEFNGEFLTVFAECANLDASPKNLFLAGGEKPLQAFRMGFPVLCGNDQIGEQFPYGFLAGEPEDPLCLSVPLDDGPVPIHRNHGIECPLHDRLNARFMLLDLRSHPFGFSHIATGAQQPLFPFAGPGKYRQRDLGRELPAGTCLPNHFSAPPLVCHENGKILLFDCCGHLLGIQCLPGLSDEFTRFIPAHSGIRVVHIGVAAGLV